MTPMPSDGHELDLGREAGPEAPEPGEQAQDRDREQVEDPLDEHRAERPRARDRGVDLEQERAVDVAELGRHEAVHEPRQEQDLGRVLDADAHAGALAGAAPSAGRGCGKPT